jgi:hypothetical protein
MLEGYPAAAEKLRESMTQRLETWAQELSTVKRALEASDKR